MHMHTATWDPFIQQYPGQWKPFQRIRVTWYPSAHLNINRKCFQILSKEEYLAFVLVYSILGFYWMNEQFIRVFNFLPSLHLNTTNYYLFSDTTIQALLGTLVFERRSLKLETNCHYRETQGWEWVINADYVSSGMSETHPLLWRQALFTIFVMLPLR